MMARSKEKTVLEWMDIHHRYGDKIIANGLDLQVAAGETVAVLGASGSGKSTLLKMAAGLLRPQRGRIVFAGEDYTRRPPERRRFAMMFQDYALLPHLTVRQNVAFGLRMQGQSPAAARQAADAMLAQVGLSDVAERRPDSLSGGEQQRAALARALVVAPQAMLLDEPFSALDSALRDQLHSLTRELLRRAACPAVLVTHNAAEAAYLADRIVLLSGGRWLQQGTASALTARPVSAEAARLLGCDNVSAHHYVPQAALHYDHPAGEPALLTAVCPQNGLWQLQWQHARYGSLRQWLPAGITPPQSGCHHRLWVDAAAIIVFDDASEAA